MKKEIKKSNQYKFVGSIGGKIFNHVAFMLMLVIFIASVFTIDTCVNGNIYRKSQNQYLLEHVNMDFNAAMAYEFYQMNLVGDALDPDRLEWYTECKEAMDPKNTNFRCVVLNDEGVEVAGTFDEEKDSKHVIARDTHSFEGYVVMCYLLDSEYTGVETDQYTNDIRLVQLLYSLRYWAIVTAIISLLAMILIAGLIIKGIGRKSDCTDIEVGYSSKVPYDLLVFLVVIVFQFFFSFVDKIVQNGNEIQKTIWVCIYGILAVTAIIGLLESLVLRCKIKTAWNNNITVKLVKWMKKSILNVIHFLPTTWVVTVGSLIILIVSILCMVAGSKKSFVFFVLIHLCVTGILIKNAMDYRRVEEQVKRISKGQYADSQIEETLVPWLQELSDELTTIGNGFQDAVAEQMRSERMKTELITNVSHDIKTPLTSIINYVDLLKTSNEIKTAEGKEYIEVLERQSHRLKKMTEDLVQFSKANTGNMEVCMEKMPIDVMLEQSLGEYDDKFGSKNLQIMTRIPEEEVYIYADGRLTWRILDNILGNVYKYALAGSRVYIDIVENETDVRLIVKNISEVSLNISGEELMERFVRGDASRNTEGSGLGLSIAKSFAEMMNGDFSVHVDGDLFKVEVVFARE